MVGTLSTVFALLAIFIACLGLFGLAAFTAEQRVKEIGARKVLGASVASIVSLLSKDIDWWVFAFAGLLSLIVALLTISFQSIKAGLVNPVKSLKSE